VNGLVLPLGGWRLVPIPLGLAVGVGAGALLDAAGVTDGPMCTAAAMALFAQACVFTVVPPFRSADPRRAVLDYRSRRALWLYALPLCTTGLAAFWALAGRFTGSVHLEQGMLGLMLFAPSLGVAWAVAEVSDRLPRRLAHPRRDVVVTVVLAIIAAAGTAIVLITGVPVVLHLHLFDSSTSLVDLLWVTLFPADVTVSLMLACSQVVLLGLLVPTCEAAWGVRHPAPAHPRPWALWLVVPQAAFLIVVLAVTGS